MAEGLLVHQLSVGPLQVNCFVVACQKTREAMVIDPGGECPQILQLAESNGYQVKQIVNTHGHFDHIGANQQVKDATGAVLMMHEADLPLLQNARNHAQAYGLTVSPSPDPDKFLNEGDVFSVGEQSFSVFHVPGHSPGSLCLLSDGHLFVGDVLFAGSIGRTDLPGGDFDALVEGVREKLFRLPAETIVHPGHGSDTTIGREKQMNPFVGDGA
ncbi:MBL fold metallo-hydrolase [Deltaproteobacteria bacterium IMCC39524]|nr:MBL fold metallo-hydrolase [Deltaproteobacteria bacterium IMCC39524]